MVPYLTKTGKSFTDGRYAHPKTEWRYNRRYIKTKECLKNNSFSTRVLSDMSAYVCPSTNGLWWPITSRNSLKNLGLTHKMFPCLKISIFAETMLIWWKKSLLPTKNYVHIKLLVEKESLMNHALVCDESNLKSTGQILERSIQIVWVLSISDSSHSKKSIVKESHLVWKKN